MVTDIGITTARNSTISKKKRAISRKIPEHLGDGVELTIVVFYIFEV